MGKHKKERDLVCSECGSVQPIKQCVQIIKIKGFRYVYCFTCKEMTRHQSVEAIDMYLADLERKLEDEYSTKDRIIKRALRKNISKN